MNLKPGKKFSLAKSFKKFLTVAVEVVIAGILSVYSNNTLVLGLAPLFELIRNIIKHYKD